MYFEKNMEKKSNTCVYCGNNPVPHFLTWYHESLNVLLAPLRRLIFYNGLFSSSRLFGNTWKWSVTRFFYTLKIISYQPDIAKCQVERAKVLWEEAEKRGYKMTELLLFGKPFDTYVVEKYEIRNTKYESTHKSNTPIIFSGLPRPENYDKSMLDVLDDKAVFKEFMQAAKLPVAVGVCTRSFKKALAVFGVLQKPVIVKPRAGSRGRHSSTFISTKEELKTAFQISKQLCSWVVVEEQLFGPVYRATIINGQLAGVLRGDPPQVTGDGISNIRDLVEKKNKDLSLSVKPIKMDLQSERFLSRQSLSFQSVLPKGRTVDLLEKVGISYGGSSSEDFEICHSENKELFLRAAKALKDPILGFDFIIPDITKSYKEQRCGFIEVNTLPFINLHHDPLLGKPRNVAALVWDMMLAEKT
jgi:cyanophycin synthetase